MTCYEWLIVTEGPFHRLFWYFGDHQSPPQSHFWSVVVGKHVFSLLNFGPWNMLNISKHGMCFFQMTIQYFWWLTHQTVEACNILIYFAPRARVVPLGIFGHLIWSERSMIIIDGVLFEANHSMGKPSNYMILYGYLWYIYIYIYIYIYYLWYIDDGVVLTPSHIQNLVRAWRQRDRSTDATRRVYRLYHMWRSWLGQHKALGYKYHYLMSLNVYIYIYVCVIVRVYYN
jgi:hypothetical protein